MKEYYYLNTEEYDLRSLQSYFIKKYTSISKDTIDSISSLELTDYIEQILDKLDEGVKTENKHEYFKYEINIEDSFHLLFYIASKESRTDKTTDKKKATLIFMERILEICNRINWGFIEFDKTNIAIIFNQILIKPVQIDSLSSFVKGMIESDRENIGEYFFRGHSSLNYRLIPSVMRNKKLLMNEKLMFDELVLRKTTDFFACNSIVDYLSLMQHYGIPTRLLDITSNPLVALYFACSEKEKSIGEVIILVEEKSRVRYSDSSSVMLAASLARLNYLEMESVLKANKDCDEVFGKITYILKKDQPGFENRIKYKDLHDIYFVKVNSNSNQRIVNQSGSFIIFTDYRDAEKLVESKRYVEKTKKIVYFILPSSKSSILEELSKLNINSATMYTSLQDVSKYIVQSIEKY